MPINLGNHIKGQPDYAWITIIIGCTSKSSITVYGLAAILFKTKNYFSSKIFDICTFNERI